MVEVEASDSEQGILDLLKGECDFAMVSRELEYYEKEVFDYEMIAKDGIGIAVNRENPLEDIRMEQLKRSTVESFLSGVNWKKKRSSKWQTSLS